jgi:hypothetical protein
LYFGDGSFRFGDKGAFHDPPNFQLWLERQTPLESRRSLSTATDRETDKGGCGACGRIEGDDVRRKSYDCVVACVPVTVPYHRHSTNTAHWGIGGSVVLYER